MVKQAPTTGRLLVMTLFALSCFGLLLFLWTSFGGPVPFEARGYQVKILVTEGVQLAEQADVRISGVPVGRVVKLVPDGRRELATLQIDSKYAPLHGDVRAMLRQKTLLGETFVELTPGSRGAPAVPEGGTLPASAVTASTQLDEVTRALDPRTRADLRRWVIGWAAALHGRTGDLNDVLGDLQPATANGASLLGILDSQRHAVARLVRDSGVVFGALGRRDALTRTLITASDRVLAATSSRDAQLTDALHVLPTFLEQLRPTLAVAERVAGEAEPSLATLRRVAPLARPVLREAYALAPDLRALLHEAGPVLDAAHTGLPAATRVVRAARPLLRILDPVGRDLEPVAQYLGVYRREFVQNWMNIAAATQATFRSPGAKAPLHYLRVLIPVNSEAFVQQKRRLPSNRHNAYFAPGALTKLAGGLLESYDCRNTANPPGFPPAELLGGSPPSECKTQAPWAFRGRTASFPRLERAAPASPNVPIPGP